jgi:hypothetical protein
VALWRRSKDSADVAAVSQMQAHRTLVDANRWLNDRLAGDPMTTPSLKELREKWEAADKWYDGERVAAYWEQPTGLASAPRGMVPLAQSNIAAANRTIDAARALIAAYETRVAELEGERSAGAARRGRRGGVPDALG